MRAIPDRQIKDDSDIAFYNNAFERADSIQPVRGEAALKTLAAQDPEQIRLKVAYRVAQLESFF